MPSFQIHDRFRHGNQILNQLVDHQGSERMNSPDELGAGAARARLNPTLLSPIVLFVTSWKERRGFPD